MPEKRLKPGRTNKFQTIKALCAKAEAEGKKIFRLSIGQPSGPALLSARKAAALAVMSEEESMHEYQDNSSPGVPDFARRFVYAHISIPNANLRKMAFLPIPGIKPMLGLIPMACGGILWKRVATMTNPGYPTPADACNYQGQRHYALPTNKRNQFLFLLEDILVGTDLLMLNYPHNPSGQAVDRHFWSTLCAFCEKNNIRIFNDAAYIALAHDLDVCGLSEVAVDFPNLSWAEAFSASKLIGNGTGWRIGAMVGSPDFIDDIATIKGNTDSGFFAPAAQGVITAMETDQAGIKACRRVYAERIDGLIDMLNASGLRLAVKPRAGFFTLWKVPHSAFGQEIKDAETFNNLMIERTGIVGVPFGEYIRYAVTSPVMDPLWQKVIREGFKKADVSY